MALQEGKHAARSPYLNPAEQCRNKGKSEIMNSEYREIFVALRNKTSKYYRTTRFTLDVYRYLDRKTSECAEFWIAIMHFRLLQDLS